VKSDPGINPQRLNPERPEFCELSVIRIMTSEISLFYRLAFGRRDMVACSEPLVLLRNSFSLANCVDQSRRSDFHCCSLYFVLFCFVLFWCAVLCGAVRCGAAGSLGMF
jgi:hypothetical protein